MPRKMKKLEGMEAAPSRQESIPGPSPEIKRARRAIKADRFQAETSAAIQEAMEEDDLRAKLAPMSEEQAFTSHEAAESMLKAEKKKQFLKMKGEGSLERAQAALEPAKKRERITREVAQDKINKELLTMEDRRRVVAGMADAIDAEPKPKKQDIGAMVDELREMEEKRMMEEEVLGIKEAPRKREKKVETQVKNPRQEMVSELIEMEGVNQKQEAAQKEMEDLDKEWAERIKRDIEESESKAMQLQKSHEVSAGPTPEQAQLEKAREIAREATAGERIRANVQSERAAAEMDPARKRAITKLKKLEAEHAATGQRLQDLTGMSPEDAYEKLVLNGGFMQRMRRGLAKLANVPTYDLLDSWIESGKKLEQIDRDVVGVYVSSEQKFKAAGLKRMYREPSEDDAIDAIEADYNQGIVRDAEGAVIEDEKKISAKRTMSRVPGRKVSMSTGGITEAMRRAEPVRMYQPGAEAEVMPRMRSAKAEAPAVEENEMQKYQKERATDINVVRKEYPRAAEIWNSIASRLQGMEKDQLEGLQEIFGTRDLATAYVLDRAFYDMDGDQQAKDRLQKADKLMGIEETSPKKVRPKLNKKAA